MFSDVFHDNCLNLQAWNFNMFHQNYFFAGILHLYIPFVTFIYNPFFSFCPSDLELATPGSYVPNQPVIRISQVNSSLQVITSKQRPRKLCITGSNGKEYMFLLKGHEDLRQDERVMQLFSLVNTLLIHDPETFRRNLTIQVRMQIVFTLDFLF